MRGEHTLTEVFDFTGFALCSKSWKLLSSYNHVFV